jgi:tetratricopeptide (TPR) repeat protein
MVATVFLAASLVACGKAEQAAPAVDGQVSLDRAQQYQAEGQYRAALIELRKAEQNNADPIQLAVTQGQLLYELGQYRAAVDLLREIAPGQRTKEINGLLLRAMIHAQKLASAERLLESVDNLTIGEQVGARAEIAFLRGQLGQARRMYEARLDALPNDIDASLGLASVEAAEGNKEAALARVDRVLAEHPKHTIARIARARILVESGDLARAEDALSSALIDLPQTDIPRPEKNVILNLLIDILTKQGRTSEALVYSRSLSDENQQATEVQRRFQEGMDLWENGELASAKAAFEEVYESSPSDTTGTMLGMIAYLQGNHERASDYFRRHTDPETASAGVLGVMSRSLAKEGRLDEALAAVQKARKNTPNNTDIQGLEGLLLLASGDKSGEPLVKRSLAKNSKQKDLWIALSRSYAGQGEFEDAEKALASGLEQFPNDFILQQARVGVQLTQKDFSGANALLKAWLKADKNNAGLYLLKGQVALIAGDLEVAKAAYKEVLTNADKTHVKAAHGGLISVYMQMPDLEMAEIQSRALIEFDPKSDAGYKYLVNALEAQKKGSADSIARMLNRYALDAQDITPNIVLAEYYFRNNLLEEALQSLEAARELEPGASRITEMTAAVLYQKARKSQSEKSLDKSREYTLEALRLQPENLTLRQFLVRIELQAKNFDEAEKLITHMKTPPKRQYVVDELRGDLAASQGNFARAETHLITAWEANSADTVAHKIYRVLKAQEKPVMAFLQEWKLRNGPAAQMFIAGEFLARADYAKAIEAYESLLSKQPENAVALNNLAWSYFKMKDKRARSTAEKALAVAGDSAPMLDTLGVILLAEGDYARAVEVLQKAAQLAPDNAEIAEHLKQARAKL